MRNTPECMINLITLIIVHPQYCYGQSIDYTINHPSISLSLSLSPLFPTPTPHAHPHTTPLKLYNEVRQKQKRGPVYVARNPDLMTETISSISLPASTNLFVQTLSGGAGRETEEAPGGRETEAATGGRLKRGRAGD